MGCNYVETPGMNRASRAGLCMSCACALANWNAIEFSGSLRLTLLLSFGTSKSLSHVFQSSTIPICSRQLHARYTSQRAHTVHAMENMRRLGIGHLANFEAGSKQGAQTSPSAAQGSVAQVL